MKPETSAGVIGQGIIGMKHAALPADDLKRVFRFYTETLGFKSYYSSDTDWAMVSRGGTSVALVKRPDTAGVAAPQRPEGVHPSHLGFTVASTAEVDQFHAKITAAGVKASAPKHHRDGSYGFYFLDTEGNNLELIFIPHAPYPATTDIKGARQSANSAMILIARGAKDNAFRRPLENFLDELQTHLPSTPVTLAYLDFAPSLETAFTELFAKHPAVQNVQVAPLFVSNNPELLLALPKLVTELGRQFPKHTFTLLPPVGESAAVKDAMLATLVESHAVSN